MITTVPAVRPVTTPVVASTLPLELLELHEPPGKSSLRVVLAATHTTFVPWIVVGIGFTVTAVDVATTVLVQPVPG